MPTAQDRSPAAQRRPPPAPLAAAPPLVEMRTPPHEGAASSSPGPVTSKTQLQRRARQLSPGSWMGSGRDGERRGVPEWWRGCRSPACASGGAWKRRTRLAARRERKAGSRRRRCVRETLAPTRKPHASTPPAPSLPLSASQVGTFKRQGFGDRCWVGYLAFGRGPSCQPPWSPPLAVGPLQGLIQKRYQQQYFRLSRFFRVCFLENDANRPLHPFQ